MTNNPPHHAPTWSSLEWKIDWEHRYGVTSPGPREWGMESRVEQSVPAPSPSPSPSPPPADPSPPAPLPIRPPIAMPVAARAVAQPTDNEAIEVDHDSRISPGPPPDSSCSPSRLLARPPLIRSETKGTAAKLAAAGQTRSETIQEARGPGGGAGHSPQKRVGAGRRHLSLDLENGERAVIRRIHSMDFEANELLLAPSKDSAENDPARRLKAQDSFDSLDFREVLASEWEHRYGVPTFADSGSAYDHRYPYSSPVDPQLVAATQAVTCAHCEDQPASVFCSSCGAVSFCHECDVVLHRAVKLRAHTRQRTWKQGEVEVNTSVSPDPSTMAEKDMSTNGEYEIERAAIRILVRLGEGYFGVVYKGLWAGQNVAVKKLKHGSRRHIQEFTNEVRVLAKLRHPNITNFYGVTSAPDHLIVTELLHGSLYRLLHFQSGPLSLALKIRIAKDIACGAAYIHGLNPSIVHRDINSSNVLVTGDLAMLQRIVDEGRSEPVAKLSDFGLSRSVERFMTQCTGNAYYLAPEVFRGQHYTEKADCYSYGVLVWELFTQRYPFSDLNPRSAAFQQSELGLRPPITEEMNVIPEALAVMQRAWQADPEDRMPFKDIVSEWEKVEAARIRRNPSAAVAPSAESQRRVHPAMPLSGGEYLFTPLEFRKIELEQRLMRRPSIFQLMQKDIIPLSYDQGDQDLGEDMAFHSLLGYDLMRPDLMKTRAISIQ